MIEQFLQRKLAHLVDQFIEFQKLMLMTAQGMTIKNSKIKPKLAQLLSQVMHMPLQLVSGSISSLTLNKPWGKLFFFVNSPIKIVIEDVHIKTKLPNQINEEYLLKMRQNLVERITQGLFNPLEAILHHNHSYINKKLKEYFLSTIILQVKNICFEVEVDLKHRITLIVKIEHLRFRKQDKGQTDKQKIHLQILGAGVYYKVFGQKEVEFISPTRIQFQRIKTEDIFSHKRSSTKTLNIQKLQFNVNNINYGDIARIILLIQWHNSFQSLPYMLWEKRPFILSELKPYKKFLYVAQMIHSSLIQSNFRKQLKQRREYITLYDKLLVHPNDFTAENKVELLQLEKNMPMWKIIALRSFCINIYKNKILAKKKKVEEMAPNEGQNLDNTGWFRNWLATQKNKQQLQQQFLKKINTIAFVPDDIVSIFYVSIDKLKLKLSIVTQFGVQPFISVVGTDVSFKNTQYLLEKTWQKHIEIIRCKVQYQKYLGHSERYRNFISECRQHLDQSQIFQGSELSGMDQEEDEFQEVGKFLQINFKHDSRVIEINLLPFDIFINHDVIQKFSILLNLENLSKLAKIGQLQDNFITKSDPWLLVQKEKEKVIELKRSQQIQSLRQSTSVTNTNTETNQIQAQKLEPLENAQKQMQQKEIIVRTTFNIIVPFDLRSARSPQLVIQVAEIFFNKNKNKRIVELKGILVKYKMHETEASEYEQYGHIANYLAPRIEQKIIVRRFNIKYRAQKHQGFEQNFLDVDSINIEIPPQNFLFSLIELIYLHVPKSKESRAKQFIRRKQSIGQQFIDACENLKEQIAKSMIMSSQRMTKNSIILQRKTKQFHISFRGINITQKDFQFLVGEINARYNEISFDNLSLSSHNTKNIKLTVHNIRRMIESIKNLKLHITKQSIKRGLNIDKAKNSGGGNYLNTTISQINLQVIISLKSLKSINSPSINFQVKDLYYQNNIQGNYKELQASIGLYYDEQIPHSQRFNPIPFVQPVQINYRQSNDLNLMKRSLNIEKISINIKPSIFKFFARALKDYYLDDTTACTVVNETINSIKIKKSHQNYYNEYKHNQKFTTQNYYCEMLLFGTKYQLQFNQHKEDIPKQKIQRIEISDNNFLINSETSPNNYVLQSNIRILNHQDKTLWLKVTQFSSTIITPEYQYERQNLQRLSMTPKRHFDIDLTQRIDEQSIRNSFFSRTAKIKSSSMYAPQIEKSKLSGKAFNIPLKPKQKVHLLIDPNDHRFLQILDQGVNFTQLCLNELFDQHQKVIKGEGQYEDQYLIIRSQISSIQGIQGAIYTFHIYSPIYIVNKTPWELQYRLSEQQVALQQEDSRRIGRRRSFQLIPLKKIPILSSEKLRHMHYNQIQTMKLQLNKCEREISSLLNLIVSIKEKKGMDGDGFLKQTKLITLRHKKKEIQLILGISFSPNILKIKLYPQFIFVNMTKEIITFKIKEDQITYPQITIPGINLEHKSSKDLRSKQKFIEHISQYINLSDQKIKERDALKLLFENFANNLQVFTGKLQQEDTNNRLNQSGKNKKKMIYNTTFGKQKSMEMRLLGKSSKGYLSDYGSDGQFREQMTDFTEQPLQQDNLLIYSQQKYVFYKRVLKIDEFFNLIIMSPTVHIINKSQATFHAKSSCQHLVTIHKNDHHYIHINQSSIDIQASFVDEEISLNEWMKLDLTRLGTIYYSKDMIQHHGSGYQSKQYTLRKRRMRKVPKIFYRILLCKFERGQKILIEESQYPPITFLNNTKHRIKIQQPKQHFIQEFLGKGQMGEYAPKDPYYSPRFRLYIGQQLEYKLVLQFGVQKKQNYNIDKDMIVSVEEYKDKTIVHIKNKAEMDQNANFLNMSILQRAEGYQNNNLLEETTKFILQINEMAINVLNNWNRELNANLLQDICLVYENKNYKDYYKFEIRNIEGYDYMDIKPDFIYKRKKKEKFRLGLPHKEDRAQQQMFLNCQLITNYHKNALLIEKCIVRLDEIVFYLSTDLILAYAKNYYEPVSSMIKVYQYYESHQAKGKSDLSSKTFIFESLQWYGTSLKLQTRNLSIMETFLNKQYQKWLVKFINWLGDIKPISIETLKLTYQQVTLGKLKNHINIKKKVKEIAKQLMDYPLKQLEEVILFMLGQTRTMKEKLTLFYNVLKSFEYIANFTLSINENLKSKLKTYKQIFTEIHKENDNIIDKMMKFQYCEWKYRNRNEHIPSSLQKKIRRLQRYNTRNSILKYDDFKAKIKLALDNHLQNKNFKRIQHVYRINMDFIFAIALQFAVIYFLKENRWIVIPVQHVISFAIIQGDIELTFIEQQPDTKVQINRSNLKTMRFSSIELNEHTVSEVRSLMNENKLVSYY